MISETVFKEQMAKKIASKERVNEERNQLAGYCDPRIPPDECS